MSSVQAKRRFGSPARADGRRQSARSWLVRTLRLAIAVGILVSAGPSVVYLRDSLDSSRALYKDVGQDILLAHAVADGVHPYVPMRDLAARYLAPVGYLDKPYPSPHPPSVGVLFLPFLLLNYVDAVRVWFGLQLIGLVAGVGLAIQGPRWFWYPPSHGSGAGHRSESRWG